MCPFPVVFPHALPSCPAPLMLIYCQRKLHPHHLSIRFCIGKEVRVVLPPLSPAPPTSSQKACIYHVYNMLIMNNFSLHANSNMSFLFLCVFLSLIHILGYSWPKGVLITSQYRHALIIYVRLLLYPSCL